MVTNCFFHFWRADAGKMSIVEMEKLDWFLQENWQKIYKTNQWVQHYWTNWRKVWWRWRANTCIIHLIFFLIGEKGKTFWANELYFLRIKQDLNHQHFSRAYQSHRRYKDKYWKKMCIHLKTIHFFIYSYKYIAFHK